MDEQEEELCEYVKDSNQPCGICPQLISCLYMCGLLQEQVKS